MTVVPFARALLDSGDLDPAYVLLAGSGLPAEERARWCVGYWLFYHAATATRLSRPGEWGFWNRAVADLDAWPRGAERRHFRGAAARSSVAGLAGRFPRAEDAAAWAAGPGRAADVMARVARWRGFGPWISFKVADMVDRCLDRPLDWSGCESVLYREPRAGIALVAAEEGLPDDPATVLAWLLDRLHGRKAPPLLDRPLGLPEAETVFCKYKSHRAGRYPVGKDTREIRHALESAGFPELARCLPS